MYPIGRKVIESAALENNGRNSMFLRLKLLIFCKRKIQPNIDVYRMGEGSCRESQESSDLLGQINALLKYKIITEMIRPIR